MFTLTYSAAARVLQLSFIIIIIILDNNLPARPRQSRTKLYETCNQSTRERDSWWTVTQTVTHLLFNFTVSSIIIIAIEIYKIISQSQINFIRIFN